jgi:hypothetical protein
VWGQATEEDEGAGILLEDEWSIEDEEAASPEEIGDQSESSEQAHKGSARKRARSFVFMGENLLYFSIYESP